MENTGSTVKFEPPLRPNTGGRTDAAEESAARSATMPLSNGVTLQRIYAHDKNTKPVLDGSN